ncbi:MAG: hypothetical protein IPL41_05865 [Micropruina sp.]|nr:hypothetical protein [Micropruina sp.]
MDDYLWVLKDSERDLIRELEPERLNALEEDELLNLHKRVRRARNKHTTNYRRKAARTVQQTGGRGAAHPKGAKDRLRAEAFEEALSIVSARLAKLAHQQSAALKKQRLAQARAGRSTGPGSDDNASATSSAGRARTHAKTTGGVKRDASSTAAGARRQAKKDAR